MHKRSSSVRARIASYIGPRALAPNTRAALQGLGYEIVPVVTQGRFSGTGGAPSIRLADEMHFDKLPSLEDDATTPIILLTGTRPRTLIDPRIVGRVERPGRLADIFPLLQEAFETLPRKTARVSTQLSARCIRNDHRWIGNIVSLSEGGCLFKTDAPGLQGETMNLQLSLPQTGIVASRAVCCHRGEGEMGLTFSDLEFETRSAIDAFVTRRLASLPRPAPPTASPGTSPASR
jgi:hypothetical protein